MFPLFCFSAAVNGQYSGDLAYTVVYFSHKTHMKATPTLATVAGSIGKLEKHAMRNILDEPVSDWRISNSPTRVTEMKL